MSLLVRPAHQAEMALEQVVAQQPLELPGHFPLSTPDDLRHGGLRVVVGDPRLAHRRRKRKARRCPSRNDLRAFPREHLAVDRIRVRQTHHEQGDLSLLPPDLHVGKPEVHLGFTRGMRQRQEHLFPTQSPGTYRVLDDRVTTREAVLVTQPFPDPLGRVPLLARCLLICLQNLLDDRQKRLDLRPGPRPSLAISWRLLMRQNLLQRLPVQSVLLAGRTLAQLLRQNLPANFCPQFHVGVHSCTSLQTGVSGNQLPDLLRFLRRYICAPHFSAAVNPATHCVFRPPSTSSSEIHSFVKGHSVIHRIVMTINVLHRLVAEARRAAGRWHFLPAGINHARERFDWLIGRWAPTVPNPNSDAVLAVMADPGIQNQPVDCPIENRPQSAILVVGFRDKAGSLSGRIIDETGIPRPLSAVQVVDHRLELSRPITNGASRPDATDVMRSSRQIDALTEHGWLQRQALRMACIGTGRTGHLWTSTLIDVHLRQVTMIDHDLVELHNLGEMTDLSEQDIGRPKVEALADAFRRRVGSAFIQIDPIAKSVLSWEALSAIKECDFISCCVDDDAARLACGLLAAAYLKPLLDFGSSILLPPSRSGSKVSQLRMGTDIRLILPDACLACMGGVADRSFAPHDLAAALDGITLPAPRIRDWRTERAGSLRSLNGVGVHLALRLLEDFCSGQVTSSRWVRFEVAATGEMRLNYPEWQPVAHCPVCALRGQGDAVFGRLDQLWQPLSSFL